MNTRYDTNYFAEGFAQWCFHYHGIVNLLFLCYFVEQIYDKWTEGVLAKRDDAVCNAEGREEVIMKIHTELEENIKKVHERKLLVK